jgi:hypothetical protein
MNTLVWRAVADDPASLAFLERWVELDLGDEVEGFLASA